MSSLKIGKTIFNIPGFIGMTKERFIEIYSKPGNGISGDLNEIWDEIQKEIKKIHKPIVEPKPKQKEVKNKKK